MSVDFSAKRLDQLLLQYKSLNPPQNEFIQVETVVAAFLAEANSLKLTLLDINDANTTLIKTNLKSRLLPLNDELCTRFDTLLKGEFEKFIPGVLESLTPLIDVEEDVDGKIAELRKNLVSIAGGFIVKQKLSTIVNELAISMAFEFNTKLVSSLEKEFAVNLVAKLDDLSEEIASLVQVSPLIEPEHKELKHENPETTIQQVHPPSPTKQQSITTTQPQSKPVHSTPPAMEDKSTEQPAAVAAAIQPPAESKNASLMANLNRMLAGPPPTIGHKKLEQHAETPANPNKDEAEPVTGETEEPEVTGFFESSQQQQQSITIPTSPVHSQPPIVPSRSTQHIEQQQTVVVEEQQQHYSSGGQPVPSRATMPPVVPARETTAAPTQKNEEVIHHQQAPPVVPQRETKHAEGVVSPAKPSAHEKSTTSIHHEVHSNVTSSRGGGGGDTSKNSHYNLSSSKASGSQDGLSKSETVKKKEKEKGSSSSGGGDKKGTGVLKSMFGAFKSNKTKKRQNNAEETNSGDGEQTGSGSGVTLSHDNIVVATAEENHQETTPEVPQTYQLTLDLEEPTSLMTGVHIQPTQEETPAAIVKEPEADDYHVEDVDEVAPTGSEDVKPAWKPTGAMNAMASAMMGMSAGAPQLNRTKTQNERTSQVDEKKDTWASTITSSPPPSIPARVRPPVPPTRKSVTEDKRHSVTDQQPRPRISFTEEPVEQHNQQKPPPPPNARPRPPKPGPSPVSQTRLSIGDDSLQQQIASPIESTEDLSGGQEILPVAAAVLVEEKIVPVVPARRKIAGLVVMPGMAPLGAIPQRHGATTSGRPEEEIVSPPHNVEEGHHEESVVAEDGVFVGEEEGVEKPSPPKRKIPGLVSMPGMMGAPPVVLKARPKSTVEGGEHLLPAAKVRPPVPAKKFSISNNNFEGDGSVCVEEGEHSYASHSPPLLHIKKNIGSVSGDDKAIEKNAIDWLNHHLTSHDRQLDNLYTSMSEGLNLIFALEAATGESVGKYSKRVMLPVQKIDNLAVALNFLQKKGIDTHFLNPQDLVDGNHGKILSLFNYICKKWPLAK